MRKLTGVGNTYNKPLQ